MAKRRATIGSNPLDAVIPHEPRGGAGSSAAAAGGDATPPPAPARIVKERLTIHLPIDLIDKVKDAVYWTPGLTLAGLAEDALAEAVRKLEREQGRPFARRKAPLKGGRPIK